MSKLKPPGLLTPLATLALIAFGALASFSYTPASNALGAANQTGAAPHAAGPAIDPQASAVNSAAPQFRDASVHDPSVIKVDDTFYVFGSHLAAAKTKDFMQWDKIADGVNPENPLFENVVEELKETLEWAQADTLWAADVIQLRDGRFYMYYNACKGDSPRSALGVAVADNVEGPYHDLGILLKSGMWGQPSEDGTIYDARVHPNVVDPDVFYDQEGQLWMLYGSYSGGLFILKMDETTGKPLPGQGYGKKLIGGNHSRIEGGYILYHPQTKFYYMFLSFGGLDANGGYNMRVARATRPDGPYYDAEGNDMIDVKADPNLPLFDDRSIEPYGVKLMGNFLFERNVGDPGAGIGTGYVSPGHNSAYYDAATGKLFLIFHTRFPQQGEMHQIRVHQMFMNQDGWPVVAPYRYTGETADKIKREDAVGEYKYINHGKAISADITRSQYIRLKQDGTISGAVSGTWERAGHNGVMISVGGTRYNGVFVRLWEPESQSYAMTFSALSQQGVAIWGRKVPDMTDREVVAAVAQDLSLGDTSGVIANLSLPTVGTHQSTITWGSSNPAIVSNAGVVNRPEVGAGDATVTLTATIAKGAETATKTFTVTVKERTAGSLVAHYAFEGNLDDSASPGAPGSVTGERIDRTGGTIAYAPGVQGQTAVFDGSSGVRLPDGLLAGNIYSVALWVKPDQLTMFTTTFFGAKDPNSWVSLVPMGGDFVNQNTMVWSGTAWYDASTGMQIPAGDWTHLAFTVQDGTIKVYVDGSQKFSGVNFPNVFTTTNGTFALGVNWWDTPFKGQIDELRIYDSALTAEEVAALAQ
ncbi:MAG TPA: LamG-like jellyroll fold domain-containing protein [Roseiflexaceae bacterium]|nr:LamG-like jellyroll fold domain-containing protein [Roseiflexaceae bacterium]